MSHLNELLADEKSAANLNSDLPVQIRLLRLGFHGFCKFLYGIYCPLRVTGREHLPKQQFIICANHSSHMDTTALIYATKLPRNEFAAMAAQDYFFDTEKTHITRYLMNLVPVSRKASRTSIIEAIKACRAEANVGRNIIIYPEGTRTMSGEMQEFKSGAALIAAQLNLPIVPAYISGTFKTLPKGQNIIKPGKITIRFGEKIATENLANAKNNKVYAEVTTQLVKAIKRLKEQQHGH